jgi:DNA-binding LacI/PurR family transcriptional regulator
VIDMAVTLKDIAERAGVSTTTVSRILNDRVTGVPIREETRQKVLSIAAEMGYRPNIMARALRGSRSSLIGVITQNISSRFHSQILRGINDAAVQRSYRVFLGHVARQVDLALDYGSMFEQSHADGILIVGELQGDQEAFNRLLHQHRHVVGVSDRVSRRYFPGVYGDSVGGTLLALEHLWELKHRNIVCVADPSLQDSKLRADVYSRFMREHEAGDRIRVYMTSRSFEASTQAGREIFASFGGAGQPTAIFATTDAIAIGLLQAAYQMRISVPQQVSIVGFDDIDIAGFTVPPLTTVRQSGAEMGYRAAALLIDLIEEDRDGAEIEDIVLESKLVVRQSTAAPAAG